MTWAALMPAGGLAHVARHGFHGRHRGGRLHRHDFFEIFWVETGQIEQQLPDRSQRLRAGDLTLIRPETAHEYRLPPGTDCTGCNIAFPAAVIDSLEQRHGGAGWEWRDAAVPAIHRVGRRGVEHLARWPQELVTGTDSLLEVECFVLDVLRLLRAAKRSPAGNDAPHWLQRAVADFADDDEGLALGTPALLRRCARSASHVNRVLRTHMQMSTTQVVNRLRLQRAARELATSDTPISAIALDCGFDNLGYFYRRFRERFGCTPRSYRLRRFQVTG